MDCFSGGSELTDWTASPAPATKAIAIAAKYLILMTMVLHRSPKTNRTLAEMVPERVSELVCIVAVLPPSLRQAPFHHTHLRPSVTRRVYSQGHCKNFLTRSGQELPNLGSNDPTFRAASSSSVGSAQIASHFRPRHDQKSGNESSGQDFGSKRRRSPLNYTAHVADSQRFVPQEPAVPKS